ncbi:MAG: MmgE/PrpD family protein [Tepidanaerobacteraceae bacterium]
MREKRMTEYIADVSVGLKYEDLPEVAVKHAKTLVLDVLGSMIGSRDLESSKIAREIAQELGGPAESTIVGYKNKVAAPNAAFANAIQCYGFDFVDDHNESNSHPSPATVPVSLALSEMFKKNGKALIEAIAIGNEVVCRMGASYLGKMYYQGFHPTSTCGTIGAAVSAAKLMNLDIQKTVYAQGIAGSMVAGLMAWNSEGSFTKRLQAGHPAMSGIIAARMAEKGFNGPADIFESKDGLFHAYSFNDTYDPKFIAEIGSDWMFTTSSIKVYPCCRYSGGHIDACLELVEKYNPDPEKIKKIFIRSSNYTMRLLAEEKKWDPKTVVDLQFSMPYQSAIAFVNKKMTTEEFDLKHLDNPLVRHLISLVEVVEDEEFERRYPDQYSSAVEITMEDGTKHEAVVDNPRGDKRNPVTLDFVENKFRSLVEKIYNDEAHVKEIIDYVNNLENAENIADLMKLVNYAG